MHSHSDHSCDIATEWFDVSLAESILGTINTFFVTLLCLPGPGSYSRTKLCRNGRVEAIQKEHWRTTAVSQSKLWDEPLPLALKNN